MATLPTSAHRPKNRSAIESPPLGAEGQLCAGCGAALTHDQRYCLNCGRRRAEARVPFRRVSGARPGDAAQPSGPPTRDWTPLVALGGLGALAIVLVVGVLIGKSAGPDAKQVAAAPQVIRVSGAATGGSSPAEASAFTSDWPAGESGFTVELGTLTKAGTSTNQVAGAKSAATKKGAKDVGALDSDDFGSLPGGRYVIYAGRFKDRTAAAKAQKSLKGRFPGARVVKISYGEAGGGKNAAGKPTVDKAQLQKLDNLSGDAYVKRSRKLPSTTVLPGNAPAEDGKAPGGGGAGEEIK